MLFWVDRKLVYSLWSLNDVIVWSIVESTGRSGGLLRLWDKTRIKVFDVLKGACFLTVLMEAGDGRKRYAFSIFML